jgi:hypothetical protein
MCDPRSLVQPLRADPHLRDCLLKVGWGDEENSKVCILPFKDAGIS